MSCYSQGARLFQPRSTESIDYFRNSEKFHTETNGLFKYASSEDKGHIAIGLTYKEPAVPNTSPFFYRYGKRDYLTITQLLLLKR